MITFFSVLSVTWLLGLADSLAAKAKERGDDEDDDSSTFPILLILVAAVGNLVQKDPKFLKHVRFS